MTYNVTIDRHAGAVLPIPANSYPHALTIAAALFKKSKSKSPGCEPNDHGVPNSLVRSCAASASPRDPHRRHLLRNDRRHRRPLRPTPPMNKYTVFYENSIFTYRIWAANYAEAIRTANRVINEGANTVTRYKDRRGREYYSASPPR